MWRPAALLSLSVCTGCANLGGLVAHRPNESPELPPTRVAVTPQPVVPPTRFDDSQSSAVLPAAATNSEYPAAVSAPEITLEPTAAATTLPETAVVPLNAIELNLPTTLSMIGGSQPVVASAQWRVQEAYSRLDQARVLWLPSLRAGFSFHNHDGNYQASNGTITDVHRNSFQYGLGAGATGAGTTPNPGIVSQFHFAQAIFQPKVARKSAWAASHAATAVKNEQMLRAAVGYTNLLRAYQNVEILNASKTRTEELAQLTSDFAAAGQGLRADSDRLQTELALVHSRLIEANQTVELASANLAEVLSLDTTASLIPTDAALVPIDFAAVEEDPSALVGMGLSARPELKHAQALTSAAIERLKQTKYTPLIPSVLLGYSSGEFGGGLGNNLANVNNRSDFDAQMVWEVRNLGFGEAARRRETKAQVLQAKFRAMQTMDQVAREVTQAHSQVRNASQQIDVLQPAIASALDSYTRNIERIRDGQGLPIEALQSLQALEQINQQLLTAAAEHNVAQFTLQWALGWPVDAM
ncbi:MAG: hypothetical protein Aurels2KO_18080 [Aureliella sp.]